MEQTTDYVFKTEGSFTIVSTGQKVQFAAELGLNGSAKHPYYWDLRGKLPHTPPWNREYIAKLCEGQVDLKRPPFAEADEKLKDWFASQFGMAQNIIFPAFHWHPRTTR